MDATASLSVIPDMSQDRREYALPLKLHLLRKEDSPRLGPRRSEDQETRGDPNDLVTKTGTASYGTQARGAPEGKREKPDRYTKT